MTVTTITPAPNAVQKTVGGKTVTMTPEQADAFGRELDALKERIIADLGERDGLFGGQIDRVFGQRPYSYWVTGRVRRRRRVRTRRSARPPRRRSKPLR